MIHGYVDDLMVQQLNTQQPRVVIATTGLDNLMAYHQNGYDDRKTNSRKYLLCNQ